MDSRTILEAFEKELGKTKSACEAALRQLDEAHLHVRINPWQNAIAVILQHLHGNMMSRFTDFLGSDGEKPDRDREREFEDAQAPREQIMRRWEQGWRCVFEALAPLTDADLERTVTIRKEPHTVALAIVRQIAHYSWHASQIALIGKHLLGEKWNYLTIPPGASATFNRKMGI